MRGVLLNGACTVAHFAALATFYDARPGGSAANTAFLCELHIFIVNVHIYLSRFNMVVAPQWLLLFVAGMLGFSYSLTFMVSIGGPLWLVTYPYSMFFIDLSLEHLGHLYIRGDLFDEVPHSCLGTDLVGTCKYTVIMCSLGRAYGLDPLSVWYILSGHIGLKR